MKAIKTLDAINLALETAQETEHRSHLGASLLGKSCERQIWYGFRWAFKEKFDGRMLRLFDRGHSEEFRFYGHLRAIGATVWPEDPATGQQWRISFANGHGGGSSDGIANGIPDVPEGENCLLECKTHGDKSFKLLQKEGLCQSKPEHFAQTQIYTVGLGLSRALYMAVNKNTDDLYLEIIHANPAFAKTLIKKGIGIIQSETPPNRIGGKAGAAFYLCKFCCFSDICHGNKLPEKNCRTCEFSIIRDEGKWECAQSSQMLSKADQHKGCESYKLKTGFMS